MFGLAIALGGPEGLAGGAGTEMAAFHRVIPLIYLFAGFYFLRIRPRKKRPLSIKRYWRRLKRATMSSPATESMVKYPQWITIFVILDVADDVTIELPRGFVVTINKDRTKSCPLEKTAKAR